MELKVGQKVVYPNHGVATIEQIESRQIAGTQQQFYLLRLQINNSTVMVPVQNVLAIGIRRLILQRQCQDLLAELCARFPFPSARDWKDRFREFSDVMRRGDVFAIAQVLKTLTYLNQLKPLSFRERQMMEKARYLIVSELAVVSKKPETNVGPRVDEAVAESMRVPAP